MNKSKLEQLPKETLVALLEVCLRDLHTVDGLWFLGVEKLVGPERDVDFDLDVWVETVKVEAQRIRKSFNLQGEGISLLVQAIQFVPGLISFTEFEVEQVSEREAILRVTLCYPQRARLKDGIGLFNCRGVDEAYLASFAQALDPRIRSNCEFCPPDKWFDNLWCQWHFYFEEEQSHAR